MPMYEVTEGEFVYRRGAESLQASKGSQVDLSEAEVTYFDKHPTVKIKKLSEATKENK